MTQKKDNRIKSNASELDERLERLGSEVVRASSMSEAEAEAIAATPFLYTRVRSRIATEVSRREEKEGWLSMLKVFWRAVPAMAVVAVFCLVLFLTSNTGGIATGGMTEDGVPSAPNSGIERVVFTERQPLSSDEVLATILVREDSEETK